MVRFTTPKSFKLIMLWKTLHHTAWILGWEPSTTFEGFLSSEKSGIVLGFRAKITAKDDVTITQIPRVNHLYVLLQNSKIVTG